MSHVEVEQQGDFARRHAEWHRKLRIVDVELRGMQLLTADTAEVVLDVSWHHLDESTMRGSTVSQRWKQSGRNWVLTEEHRIDGSKGLFAKQKPGEKQPKGPAARLTSDLL